MPDQRRTNAIATTVIAVVLLLAGIGVSTAAGRPSEPEGFWIAPLPQSDITHSVSEPPRPNDPTGAARDQRLVPWLAADLARGGRRLTVHATRSGCDRLSLRATEAADVVTVALTVREFADGCTSAANDVRLSVMLDHPVGIRRVVDASSGRPRAVLDQSKLLRFGSFPSGSGVVREEPIGGGDGTTPVLGWAVRCPIGDRYLLSLDQYAGESGEIPAGRLLRALTVRSVPAQMFVEDARPGTSGTLWLDWTEDGWHRSVRLIGTDGVSFDLDRAVEDATLVVDGLY